VKDGRGWPEQRDCRVHCRCPEHIACVPPEERGQDGTKVSRGETQQDHTEKVRELECAAAREYS
jgi:hypothetical protein